MDGKEAYQSRTLEGGAVQCTACEHRCVIGPGEAGRCNVRLNHYGRLFSLAYGRAAAAHVDAIEKKPLFHFLPTQPIYSNGTLGCNFHCGFCQNWQISQPGDSIRGHRRLGQELPPSEIVAICRQRHLRCVGFVQGAVIDDQDTAF